MKDLIEEIVQTALDLKEVVGINYKTDLIPMAIELHKLKAAQEANELFKKAHIVAARDTYRDLDGIKMFITNRPDFSQTLEAMKEFREKDFDRF